MDHEKFWLMPHCTVASIRSQSKVIINYFIKFLSFFIWASTCLDITWHVSVLLTNSDSTIVVSTSILTLLIYFLVWLQHSWSASCTSLSLLRSQTLTSSRITCARTDWLSLTSSGDEGRVMVGERKRWGPSCSRASRCNTYVLWFHKGLLSYWVPVSCTLSLGQHSDSLSSIGLVVLITI